MRARGLEFAPLSDDLVALVETPQGRRAIDAAGGATRGVRDLVGLVKQSLRIQRELFRDGWAAAEHTSPDLLVYHPKMAIAQHYAERLSVPAVMAPLFPMFRTTGAYPMPGFPALALGGPLTRAYNRATHRLLRTVVSQSSRMLFAKWRQAHGLPRQPLRASVVHDHAGAPVPILNGWSRHVVPEPEDVSADRSFTGGYWFPSRDDAWEPPDSLVDFLGQGPPPVYVGFGSMAPRDPKRTTRMVLDAVERAGCRAVLARGWGGLETHDLPPFVHGLGQVPHEWLFARVAAVVHHGGAGTTAAGLRAGAPTLICPFFGDQPFWGRRVQRLGVGPAPLAQRTLSATTLAAAIGELTSLVDYRQRAEALGAKLREEDGASAAVCFLEETVA